MPKLSIKSLISFYSFLLPVIFWSSVSFFLPLIPLYLLPWLDREFCWVNCVKGETWLKNCVCKHMMGFFRFVRLECIKMIVLASECCLAYSNYRSFARGLSDNWRCRRTCDVKGKNSIICNYKQFILKITTLLTL